MHIYNITKYMNAKNKTKAVDKETKDYIYCEIIWI